MSIILKAARPLGGEGNNEYHDLWMEDFKPTKVRITGVIDGAPQSCEIRSWEPNSPGEFADPGNIIGTFTGQTGEVTVNLTYGEGEYFGRIIANGYSKISKIEFNEEPPEAWYEVTWGSGAGGQHWSAAGDFTWNWETKMWTSPIGGTLTAEYNWKIGLRPRNMRITGSDIGSNPMYLQNEGQTEYIGYLAEPQGPVTIMPLTFTTNDLYYLYFYAAMTGITKIEVDFPTPEIEAA